MAEAPQPLFEVGQRVWDIQDRTGLVSEVIFAQAVNGFRYLVDGINDIFEESELRDVPFGVSQPLTFRERLASRLVAELILFPNLDVRFWVGRELEVPDDIQDEVPGQPEGGNLEDALAFWATLGFFPLGERPAEVPPEVPTEVPPEVPLSPGIDLDAVLAEVDLRIAQAIGPVVANSIVARDQLETRFTAQIEVITDALLALENIAQDATGSDLRGLFRLVGTLVSDPLGFLLERAEDVILGEVADGLNR